MNVLFFLISLFFFFLTRSFSLLFSTFFPRRPIYRFNASHYSMVIILYIFGRQKGSVELSVSSNLLRMCFIYF